MDPFLSENRGRFPVGYRYDPLVLHAWFESNWAKYCALLVTLYLAGIRGLKLYREKRKSLSFKGLLAAWNVGLAVFSLVVALRTLPWLTYVLSEKGFYYSVCSAS